ncbi:hypothetical protein, partial [Breznakibacter xylanolyticus]|uniref:hypothetical protein n=1 Tax=Breznakibacter xylanolyticus TaxID=990 RepID=UPI001472A794
EQHQGVDAVGQGAEGLVELRAHLFHAQVGFFGSFSLAIFSSFYSRLRQGNNAENNNKAP